MLDRGSKVESGPEADSWHAGSSATGSTGQVLMRSGFLAAVVQAVRAEAPDVRQRRTGCAVAEAALRMHETSAGHLSADSHFSDNRVRATCPQRARDCPGGTCQREQRAPSWTHAASTPSRHGPHLRRCCVGRRYRARERAAGNRRRVQPPDSRCACRRSVARCWRPSAARDGSQRPRGRPRACTSTRRPGATACMTAKRAIAARVGDRYRAPGELRRRRGTRDDLRPGLAGASSPHVRRARGCPRHAGSGTQAPRLALWLHVAS